MATKHETNSFERHGRAVKAGRLVAAIVRTRKTDPDFASEVIS